MTVDQPARREIAQADPFTFNLIVTQKVVIQINQNLGQGGR